MNGRAVPASTVAALLNAILGHCTDRDVALACAAILAHGCDPATVAEFTGLLSNHLDHGTFVVEVAS